MVRTARCWKHNRGFALDEGCPDCNAQTLREHAHAALAERPSSAERWRARDDDAIERFAKLEADLHTTRAELEGLRSSAMRLAGVIEAAGALGDLDVLRTLLVLPPHDYIACGPRTTVATLARCDIEIPRNVPAEITAWFVAVENADERTHRAAHACDLQVGTECLNVGFSYGCPANLVHELARPLVVHPSVRVVARVANHTAAACTLVPVLLMRRHR